MKSVAQNIRRFIERLLRAACGSHFSQPRLRSTGLSNAAPCLSDAAPCLSDAAPCLSNAAPCLSDAAPCLSDAAPCLSDATSCLSDATSCLSDAAPCLSNAAPCLSNAAPCLSNAAPCLSDAAPCLSVATSCLSDAAPCLSDDAPCWTLVELILTTQACRRKEPYKGRLHVENLEQTVIPEKTRNCDFRKTKVLWNWSFSPLWALTQTFILFKTCIAWNLCNKSLS